MLPVDVKTVGADVLCGACDSEMHPTIGWDIEGSGADRWWFWWVCDTDHDHVSCSLPAPPRTERWP